MFSFVWRVVLGRGEHHQVDTRDRSKRKPGKDQRGYRDRSGRVRPAEHSGIIKVVPPSWLTAAQWRQCKQQGATIQAKLEPGGQVLKIFKIKLRRPPGTEAL